jgi:hypothetical protein
MRMAQIRSFAQKAVETKPPSRVYTAVRRSTYSLIGERYINLRLSSSCSFTAVYGFDSQRIPAVICMLCNTPQRYVVQLGSVRLDFSFHMSKKNRVTSRFIHLLKCNYSYQVGILLDPSPRAQLRLQHPAIFLHLPPIH